MLPVAHIVQEDDEVEAIRIITARKADPRRGGAMKKPVIEYEIDLSNPPALTGQQKAAHKALQAKADSEIDNGNIPPLGDSFWKNAMRNPFYRPTKTSTTVRIDSDVLAWLRAQGKGYQSRINAILRREMLSSVQSGDATSENAGSNAERSQA